jgi:hypothetical protein
MSLDLAGSHATRAERGDLIVEAVEPSLSLLDELRIELPVAVTRDLDRDLSLLAFERLARFAVAGIAGVPSLFISTLSNYNLLNNCIADLLNLCLYIQC